MNVYLRIIAKYCVLFIAWLLLWPIVLIYYLSNSRQEILLDMMSDMKYRDASFKGANAVVYVFFMDRYYRNLFYHRIGKISFLFKCIWKGSKTFYPLCPNIGGGMFCIHPYATILNAKSIGRNFSCRQCTTIGNKSDERPSERPTIGDNVTVGANVVIIGDIHVGNNVIIGAGSVVVKDIPDNCIVAGNPAQIIRKG